MVLCYHACTWLLSTRCNQNEAGNSMLNSLLMFIVLRPSGPLRAVLRKAMSSSVIETLVNIDIGILHF